MVCHHIVGDDLAQLAAAFARFADEARGSSALYAALSPAIAADRELLELMLAAPPTQRRANLLFAAVHDVLLAGRDHPLARYYGSLRERPRAPEPAALEAFRDFCLAARDAVRERIAARHTQTNEVRRSAALLPVLQRLSRDAPIALLEVGASAGLNLLVDRYRYRYGVGPWVGSTAFAVAIRCALRGPAPPYRLKPARIAHRLGLDPHPLDVRRAEDARWLMACVWPEHVDRLELLRAAVEIGRRDPPEIVRGNAQAADLDAALSSLPNDIPICVVHSAVMPYLTPTERNEFVRTLDRLGRERRDAAPLHWLSFEGGARASFGAALPFSALDTRRPDDRPADNVGLVGYARWGAKGREERLLARADLHGRWLEWRA